MARRFYYDTGTEKVGPVTGNELVRLRAAGQIADDTWVRREDSGTWRPLSSVNLREEEQEEANPGLWTVLKRSGLLMPLLMLAVGVIVILVLVAGVVSFAWPVLLVLFIIWLLGRALR